ncbi:MAG TPA: hypothetical protein VLX92_27690 [Kofleriaceae bacterium]|nr:hypothetical protein [Kofleriaceae bacterium]
MRDAIGLVPHTGWTWLVRVRGGEVIARIELRAVPTLDAELYHLARDHAGGRAAFLAQRRAAALATTIAALRPTIAGAAHAIVLGKQPVLPAFDAIVGSHAMIHTAEGELWRALFAEACAACGVPATRALAVTANASETRWLAAAGKTLGAPWTQEVRAAALAARRGRP